MIVQCDQCNAKFRLDDSKVKDGGAKVRCSKCKHIFIVRKEAADEADVDSFLDGLVPSQQDTAREPVITAPSVSSSSNGEAGMPPDMDSTGTSMSETLQGKDDFDFDEFTFETTPVSAPVDEPAAAPDGGFDFGALNPDTSQHFTPETWPGEAPPTTDFGFGEFTFESAPVTNPADTPVPPNPTVDFDFDEFTLDEGASGSQATPPEQSAHPEEFDFSHQSMILESDNGSTPCAEPPQSKNAFDFGGFDFDSTGDFTDDANKVGAGTINVPDDIAAFTPATQQPSSGATEISAPGTDDFFCDNISTAVAEIGSMTGESAHLPAGAGSTAYTSTSDAVEEIDFSSTPDLEFSFEPEVDIKPSAKTATCEENDKQPEQSIDFDDFDFAPVSMPGAKTATREAFPNGIASEAEELGNIAHDPFGISSDDTIPVFADEPPPLSISSRRRSAAILPMAVIAGLVILVIVVAVGGGYYFKDSPAVFKKFGLGFMASWFGAETREEGKIAVKNTSAQFMKNNEAGEIFVIRGEAVNNFDKPRASIQVKATVYGAKGEVLLQKTVYCGNTLSNEQLSSMPLAELDKRASNPFGDSLANLAVQSGKGIPFVAVLANVPAGAADFAVEAVGSTISSK
jgi:predicted Zn finger-like uncharacterized protein